MTSQERDDGKKKKKKKTLYFSTLKLEFFLDTTNFVSSQSAQ